MGTKVRMMELDEWGYVKPDSIERLTPEQLRGWISDRLRGDDPYLPRDPRDDSDPQDLFIWLYGAGSDALKEKIGGASRRLLDEVARSPEGFSDTFVKFLLKMAVEIGQRPLWPELVQLARSESLKGRGEDLRIGDLHRLLLFGLAAIDVPVPLDIGQRDMADRRYVFGAWRCLATHGLKSALEWLPSLIDSLDPHDEKDFNAAVYQLHRLRRIYTMSEVDTVLTDLLSTLRADSQQLFSRLLEEIGVRIAVGKDPALLWQGKTLDANRWREFLKAYAGSENGRVSDTANRLYARIRDPNAQGGWHLSRAAPAA